jgi:hypothetical protein
MKPSDITIGQRFRCGSKTWLCTDVGTRTVVAICDSYPQVIDDPTWLKGPPYALAETVFDEHSLAICEIMT